MSGHRECLQANNACERGPLRSEPGPTTAPERTEACLGRFSRTRREVEDLDLVGVLVFGEAVHERSEDPFQPGVVRIPVCSRRRA